LQATQIAIEKYREDRRSMIAFVPLTAIL